MIQLFEAQLTNFLYDNGYRWMPIRNRPPFVVPHKKLKSRKKG